MTDIQDQPITSTIQPSEESNEPTNDPTNEYATLKGDALYEAAYDLMNLMVGTNRLMAWADLNKEVGKDRKRVYERFIPRLKRTHPGVFENTEKIMEYGKSTGLIKKVGVGMEKLLTDINPDTVREMYRAEIANQVKSNVSTLVKEMLDDPEMVKDLLVTRKLTLQACMLAITGYFNSVQKKVIENKEIYGKEFKQAYEIYKTEMGEPINIKETRSKNMQVTLNIPVTKAEVNHILGGQQQQDLSIDVAPEFKDKMDEKFSIVIEQHGHTGTDGQNGRDGTVTQAEEVPSDSTIQ